MQAIALSVMPWDRLVSSADSAAALSVSMGEQPVRQAEDILAGELLKWFKHDFFTWVLAAPTTPESASLSLADCNLQQLQYVGA